MRLGDRALAARLGRCASKLRDAALGADWDADRVQLVACGLFGARLLTLGAAASPFGRAAILRTLRARADKLDDAVREALAEPALASAVDEMIALLAGADAGDVAAADALQTFYEPFLAAFDPELRRARGVYFTPPALAAHVVARVDALLEDVCGVERGLAGAGGIIDPAAGTGAFLTAVIERLHARMRAHWRTEGKSPEAIVAAWQSYVPDRLLPRLVGFDVLPVACALAQLQARISLATTGYCEDGSEHLHVHEANALELLEALETSSGVPPSAALSALQRCDVIVGNPPYARGGAHRGAFWDRLLEPYKAPLRAEKNLQPLADEYVRFVRLAEHLSSKKRVAVAGLVTSSTFLDGYLYRGMRESLLNTFARIDVLDLGGSAKRHARGAPGGRDENVFEVAQGIAVTLLVRTPTQTAPLRRYAALRGTRATKLARLAEPSGIHYTPLGSESQSLLVPHAAIPAEYATFAALDTLFDFYSIGAKPGDDRHLVAFDHDALLPQLEAFRAQLRAQPERARTEAARRMLSFSEPFDAACVIPYAYRPFDTRFVYDDARLWTRPVRRLRDRIDGGPSLLTTRFAKDGAFAHAFATRLLPDVIMLSNKSSVNCFAFPRSALRAGPHERDAFFAYLYAVLHSSAYRERYASAFTSGWPRVPLTYSQVLFEKLTTAGARLLALHLGELQSSQLPRYHGVADCTPRAIAALRTLPAAAENGTGRIPIAPGCFFEGVQRETWELRIGGYQVCHKWLLDRERASRPLHARDLEGYARMIGTLDEARRSVSAIDAAIDDAGGFPRAFAS